MIDIRRSQDRGHANHGWLDSYHSFSFADYYDPKFMGFRTLRVINEDRLNGGGGFPMHFHRDMEILTYIIDGELQHRDSMGNSEVIRPGEIQHMSAGSGVRHSEFNPSEKNGTHLLQIWILPNKENIEPGYGQKSYLPKLEKNWLALAASGDGRDGSVKIHQDTDLYVARVAPTQAQEFKFAKDRYGWFQVVQGEIEIAGKLVKSGDAVAVVKENKIGLKALVPTELLIFDMP